MQHLDVLIAKQLVVNRQQNSNHSNSNKLTPLHVSNSNSLRLCSRDSLVFGFFRMEKGRKENSQNYHTRIAQQVHDRSRSILLSVSRMTEASSSSWQHRPMQCRVKSQRHLTSVHLILSSLCVARSQLHDRIRRLLLDTR